MIWHDIYYTYAKEINQKIQKCGNGRMKIQIGGPPLPPLWGGPCFPCDQALSRRLFSAQSTTA